MRTVHASDSLLAEAWSIDICLFEELFDQSSEVAFFVKHHHGRYVDVNPV